MRRLLDECVPRRLKNELAGHDVHHVVEMGWSSKRNGELLTLMLTGAAPDAAPRLRTTRCPRSLRSLGAGERQSFSEQRKAHANIPPIRDLGAAVTCPKEPFGCEGSMTVYFKGS
jgi:hypothetical protein